MSTVHKFTLSAEIQDELTEALDHIEAVANLMLVAGTKNRLGTLRDETITKAAALISTETDRIRHLIDDE